MTQSKGFQNTFTSAGVKDSKSMQMPDKAIQVASFAEIRQWQADEGQSLHATVVFAPEQVISKFDAKEVLDRPNYLTVQIGEHQHIMLDPEFLQYINHSCSPNVFFDISDRSVRALRHIDIGEELTFFYPSTEWSMNQGFDCLCNSENCLGYIQGAAHIPQEVLAKYKLSPHIRQKLDT